jgi:hypothetical protein
VARGFDSKWVADQQATAFEDAARGPRPDPRLAARRRGLELKRADVLRRLASAPPGPLQHGLRLAKEALDRELAELPPAVSGG